jgi:hypothetical protein
LPYNVHVEVIDLENIPTSKNIQLQIYTLIHSKVTLSIITPLSMYSLKQVTNTVLFYQRERGRMESSHYQKHGIKYYHHCLPTLCPRGGNSHLQALESGAGLDILAFHTEALCLELKTL